MPNSQRPITLGLLLDDLQSRYQMRLLEGVRRAAHARNARVTAFLGGCLSGSPGARFDSSFLFELVTPLAVDGIIAVSTILAGEVGSAAVRTFCERSQLPLVSIGALDGFPYVDACNANGMRQVAEHAVLVHQRTRFAFIQGTHCNTDSLGRELALKEALLELGLPLLPRLIMPGDFLEASGAQAVSTLFDTRAVELAEVDCLIAANDLMAKGALDELLSRGIRVPEDVLVIGFDDDDVARTTEPALTTVAQPIEQIGARACELLLDLLANNPTGTTFSIPTELVIRTSCGCGELGSHSWGILHPPRGRTLHQHALAQRDLCLRRLANFFCDDVGAIGVDACVRVVGEVGPHPDEYGVVERAVLATVYEGLDPLRWHDVIRPLDDVISGRSPEDSEVRACRERLTNLHLRISDVAASVQARERLRTMQLSNAIRVMGSALVCVSGVRSLAPVLHAALPGLGVRSCFVCLFDENAEGKSRAKVLVRHTTDTVIHHQPLQRLQDLWRKLPASIPPPSSSGYGGRGGLLFPTVDLLPREVSSNNQIDDLVIHPLVFGQDALGYVIFSEPEELGTAWVLDAIAGHLSAAIYSILNAERLQQARDLAERAYEAKSEFVAVMSHEIRTPMTGILGQLDLCLRGELALDQRRGLELARTSGRTLLRIVNDLLDYSKIEAQRLELERVQFRLDDVWLQVIGATGMAAADKGLELVIDADLDVPDEMSGDALRLGQVLVNLTSNAVKFSSKGDITIRVKRVKVSRENEVRLEFSVRDAGIGLSEAQMQSVFLPFMQGDSSTTRRYGGTGLGLTICQRLVRLMGGELSVESALGEGSVFSFDAGFQPVAADVQATVPRYPSRILVVDDSSAQCRAIERGFSGLGFLVETVESLTEARLRLSAPASSQAVDLVLVDYRLIEGSRLFSGDQRPALELGGWQGSIAVLAPHGSELAQIESSLRGRAALVAKPLLRSTLRNLAETLGDMRVMPRPVTREQTAPDKQLALVATEDATVDVEVSEILRTAGLTVQTAKSGATALNIAFAAVPAVVLLSPNLPGMDGLAVARVLRADPRFADISMIGIAEHADADTRQRCLTAGMTEFIALREDELRLRHIVAAWRGTRGGPGPAATRLSHSAMLAVTRVNSNELDVTLAKSRLGGDESLYRRLLRRFVDTHYTSAQAIRDAILSDDWHAAERQAHALSSASDIVGATTLYQAAHGLEIVFRRGPNAGVNTLLADLDFAASITLAAAKNYLNSVALRTPPTGLSPELLRQLTKLDGLLKEHDTSAVDCVEGLRPLLPAHSREIMRRLDARIRAYDFEGAREHLAELDRSLKHS